MAGRSPQVYLSPRSWNYDWNWYRFAWQSLPAAPAAGARPSWSVRAPFWFALAAGLAPLGVAAFDG